MSPLETSLLITAIGMGLVFIAILVLWGLMELLVRLTNEKNSISKDESDSTPLESSFEAAAPDTLTLKQRAAAAAVAAALATKTEPKIVPMQRASQNEVSAWQAVIRADQMQRRDHLYNRKP